MCIRDSYQVLPRTGEFGIIEGFTGYNGRVWALTHELVFSNNAYVNAEFFTQHENYIEDTVFDDSDIVLYRDGGNQYNNVHVAGEARIFHHQSLILNTANGFHNVTLPSGRVSFGVNGNFDQQATVDTDGALTGTPGSFLTQNDPLSLIHI